MSTMPSSPDQIHHFRDLLKEFSTAMLITHTAGGGIRARPMGIAQIEDDCRLWFVTGQDSAKVHEIETDTQVHIVCQKDHSAYLSVTGFASVVSDRAKVDEIWQETFKVWFPGGKDDPGLVLLAVTLSDGEYWDNRGLNKIKYLAQSAKAYVTGQKPQADDPSQHGFVSL